MVKNLDTSRQLSLMQQISTWRGSWGSALLFLCCWSVGTPSIADIIAGQKGNQSVGALPTAGLPAEIREQAVKLLSASKLKEARELVEKAKSSIPDLPHTDLILAEWVIQMGQAPAAIQILEQAAASSKPRKDIHFSFAKIALSQGRVFDAATHISILQSLTFDPKWSPEYRQLFEDSVVEVQAEIYERRGQWESALESYTKSLDKKPGNLNLRLGVARTAFQLQKLDITEKNLRLLEQSQTPPSLAEVMIANMYESKSDKASAEQWFKKGLERSDKETARKEYAKWLIRQNRPQEALELVAIEPPSSSQKLDYLLVIAQSQQMLGQFEQSEAKLNEILSTKPDSFSALIHSAWALVNRGDQESLNKAMEQAEKANKLSPNAPMVVATVAWVQFKMGEPATAAKTFSAFQGANLPRDAAYFLAKIKESLGDTENAERIFQATRNAQGEFFHRSMLPALEKLPVDKVAEEKPTP